MSAEGLFTGRSVRATGGEGALNNVAVTFLVADSVSNAAVSVRFCVPKNFGGSMVEVTQNWGDVAMTVTISVTVGLSSSVSVKSSEKAQKVEHGNDWLALKCPKMSVSLSPKPSTFPQSIEYKPLATM